MDTFMSRTNEAHSSQNAKIYSTETVTDEICYRGNREVSASEKSISCPSEEYICDHCSKRFKSIESIYGHMGGHRRDEYSLIRTLIEQPGAIEITNSKFDNEEVKRIWNASQTLLNRSEWHLVQSNSTNVTCSSEDISGNTAQMMEMEVADLLIKLSQTGDDAVMVPSLPSAESMGKTCNKVFDSYQAHRDYISIHYNKPNKPHQLVGTSSNPTGSSEQHSWTYFCYKCNERFATGQSFGGHKRKHWFEERRKKLAADGNVEALVVSQPSMQSSEVLVLVNDELQSTQTELKGVEAASVSLQVPSEAVQPLKDNSTLAHEAGSLPRAGAGHD